jgi:tetratricopeptide (TPR) repeat protein
MADYDAFISYSHALDKPIAATLQAAIQRLGKPWYRRRALRIFRDDTSLSATPHLWPSIEQALDRSRYLILLISPQSAASPWVGKEVAYWLANKSIDTFLMAVTDGEVGWDSKSGDFVWSAATPLPPVLKGKFPAEPKWVDLRQYRTAASARDSNFIDLAADLAATIHGMPKEDLLSLEVRQQRRALMLAWSAAASLLVLACAAGWQWQIARTQRAKAENALTAATGTANQLVFDMAMELRNKPGMPVDTVINILGRAEAMQSQLAQAGNTTPELRRLEAAALGELSTTFVGQGALASARDAAGRAVAIMEDLVKLDPANTQYQRELAVTLNKLGDARAVSGDYAPALDLYDRALGITAKLADAAPDDGKLQDDVTACLTRIGAIQVVMARQTEALATFRRSVAILEGLVAKQPDNLVWQYDLSSADNRVGRLLMAIGQSAAALKAFQAGLAIRQKLVAAVPNNTEYQRGLFDNYTRVGEIFVKTGALADALAAYQNALAVIAKLAPSDTGNKQWQNELSFGYENVGDILAATGKADQALDDFQKASAIRERLAADDPGNRNWQHEIEVSQNKIGDMLIATGKRDQAIDAYRQALAIAQRLLAAAPPDSAQWLMDLAFCYVKLGDVYAAEDRAQAREAYQKALAIREKLAAADQADVQLRRDLALTYERLGGLAAVDGANDEAKAFLLKALAIREQNATSDPDNTLWQTELIVSLVQLAQAGDEPQARLEQALALARKLDAAGKLNALQKGWIGSIEQALAALPQGK